jgi:hypothetical protein
MANAWVMHVKQWALRNKMTYGCAMSDPRCKRDYQIKKGKTNPARVALEQFSMGEEDIGSRRIEESRKKTKQVDKFGKMISELLLFHVSFLEAEKIAREHNFDRFATPLKKIANGYDKLFIEASKTLGLPEQAIQDLRDGNNITFMSHPIRSYTLSERKVLEKTGTGTRKDRMGNTIQILPFVDGVETTIKNYVKVQNDKLTEIEKRLF